MTKEDAIRIYIENNWTTGEFIAVWNEVCDKNNYPDNMIYDNGEDFFNEMFGNDVMGVIRAVCYGSYNLNDDYVCFNGYGNLESFDFWDDNNSPIDIDEIIEYVIDNGDYRTPGIDTDFLQECFIQTYYEDKEEEYKEWCDKMNEEEPFDLLTEDWDDLRENLETFIEESEEEE